MLNVKTRTFFIVLVLLLVFFSPFGNPIAIAQTTTPTTRLIDSHKSTTIATVPFYLQNDDKVVTNTRLASAPYAPISDLSSFSTVIRILISLAIVIAIAFSLSWLLQKRGGVGTGPLGKVISILPIGNSRFVYMIEIAGKFLVLGVTDANINLICEITDKETLDSLRLESNSTSIPGIEKLFPFLNRANNQIQKEDIDSTKETLNHDMLGTKIKKINENLEQRKKKL